MCLSGQCFSAHHPFTDNVKLVYSEGRMPSHYLLSLVLSSCPAPLQVVLGVVARAFHLVRVKKKKNYKIMMKNLTKIQMSV